MSNRRDFFAAASSSLALASLGAPAFAMGKPAIERRVGGSPALAVFQDLQGQNFKVDTGSGAKRLLRLVAVKPHDSEQAIEQFTLVLGGGSGQRLESGIYQLEHAQAGRFQLRIEPSGRSEQGDLYRADLCLLV